MAEKIKAFDTEPLSVTMPEGLWFALLEYLDAMADQERVINALANSNGDEETKELTERITAYGVAIRLAVKVAVRTAMEDKDAQ